MEHGHGSVFLDPEREKLNSYPLFDWLRFVLASIVVLGHAGIEFPDFSNGGVAVKVFFALSGWLIGGILIRTDRNELPRFFFNRSTRIWIPYALAIVLLYTLAASREGINFFWFKYLLLDITFTHQLFTFFPAAHTEMPLDGSGNQFWSISVEEQFYLLAPLLMLFLPHGKSLRTWAPIAAATWVLGWNAAPIALGVCAAILEARTGFASRHSTRIIAIVTASGSAAILAIFDFDQQISPIFSIAVVLALAIPGKRSNIAFIAGGLSYPLYLNHHLGVFAVNFMAKRYLSIDHITFVVSQYGLNLILSYGLYWLVDRQIQLRRNEWYSQKSGIVLGATAYVLVLIGIVAGSLMHVYGPRGG